MLNTVRSTLVFIVVASLVGFVLGMLGIDGITRTTMSIAFASTASLLATHFAGNRKGVRIEGADKAGLLGSAAPPDKAVLLVYRQGFNGMAVGVDVQVDDTIVAQLRSPACTRVTLEPGERRLTAMLPAGTTKPATLELVARAGETLAVQVKMGIGKMTLIPQPDLAAVRARLAGIAMVAPEQAEA